MQCSSTITESKSWVQALPQRTDGKLYRIQTPQTPIARTEAYERFNMDEFPNGTNMIVAVLAYTGDPLDSFLNASLQHGPIFLSSLRRQSP